MFGSIDVVELAKLECGNDGLWNVSTRDELRDSSAQSEADCLPSAWSHPLTAVCAPVPCFPSRPSFLIVESISLGRVLRNWNAATTA